MVTLASVSCVFRAFIEGAVAFVGGAVTFIEGAVTFIGGAVIFIGLAVKGRSFEVIRVKVVDGIKGVDERDLR